jgi:integrase
MQIPESQLAKLQAFGYTEVEARFLYIAATHSGYFTVRQFLSFAQASYGKRSTRFVEKLLGLGHASAQRYRRNGLLYHLDCRQVYAAIGRDYLRRRRKHELRYIRTRLLGLDFIMAHAEDSYFETAEAKRRHFIEGCKVDPKLFSATDGKSAKRERLPEVLDVGEISSLLTELQYPYKAMVFLAAATGLRASELLGLQWQDVDFDLLQINLSRGVVHQAIGRLKTEASQKPIPLDPDLASALLEWRYLSPFNQQCDWVFASAEKKGRQPYWPENLLRRYIRPAAARCGISKRSVGTHFAIATQRS